MHKQHSIADARNHLTKLVRQVEQGHAIELTRRGKPVVVMISAKRFARMERPSFADAAEAFRKREQLADLGLERAWLDGLRDCKPPRDVKL